MDPQAGFERDEEGRMMKKTEGTYTEVGAAAGSARRRRRFEEGSRAAIGAPVWTSVGQCWL